nr:DUF5682 family protein [Streptomyces sp. DHE17-7]
MRCRSRPAENADGCPGWATRRHGHPSPSPPPPPRRAGGRPSTPSPTSHRSSPPCAGPRGAASPWSPANLPLADRAWAEGSTPGTPRTPTPPVTPAPEPTPTTTPTPTPTPTPTDDPTAAVDSATATEAPRPGSSPGSSRSGLADALRARLTGRPGEDLWDRLVEATAPGSSAEALRRAALLTGWALREEAAASGGVPELDLRRERWMRACLARATADGARAAVAAGASNSGPCCPRRPSRGPTVPTPPGSAAPSPAATSGPRPHHSTQYPPSTRVRYPAAIGTPEWQHLVLRPRQQPTPGSVKRRRPSGVRRMARNRDPSAPRTRARSPGSPRTWPGCAGFRRRAGASWWRRCRRCSLRASRTAGGVPSRGRWNRCWSGRGTAVRHREPRAVASPRRSKADCGAALRFLPRRRHQRGRRRGSARGRPLNGTGAAGPPGICGSTPCGPTSTGVATCCCAA